MKMMMFLKISHTTCPRTWDFNLATGPHSLDDHDVHYENESEWYHRNKDQVDVRQSETQIRSNCKCCAYVA